MAEYGDSLIVQKLFSGINGAEYPAQLAAYWQALAVFGSLWQALAGFGSYYTSIGSSLAAC
jgi:hypothetical protein